MTTKIINKIRLTILLISLQALGHAQDIHFSQFFETPLLRNPALAGILPGANGLS